MPTIKLSKQNSSIKVVYRTDKIKLTRQERSVILKRTGSIGPKGDTGFGIPAGGTAGQILEKESGVDYAARWADPSDTFGDKNYYQTFPASTTVTVNHNLNKYPSVTIFDSSGDEVEGVVTHIDTTSLILTFSAAFSGNVTCN